MKDIPLSFDRNDDPTPVRINNIQHIQISNSLRDVSAILKDLMVLYEKKQITTELLSNMDEMVIAILNGFGYDQYIENEIIKKKQIVKQRLYENQMLSELLNDKTVSSEDVREKIKNLKNLINKWWDVYGFGHICNIHFNESNVNIKFSGMMCDGYTPEGKKYSIKEKVKLFKSQGFKFEGNDILDNDNNRSKLNNIICSKFPSAIPMSLKSYWGRKSSPILREIEYLIKIKDLVSISDLENVVFEYGKEIEKTESDLLKKHINESMLVISTMVSQYNEQRLEKGFSETLLSCLEHYISDIFKIFNFEGKISEFNKRLYKDLREANNTNHNLRIQLGNKTSLDDIEKHLKELNKSIKNWWGVDGLGYTKDVEFGDYGAKVDLYLHISDYYDADPYVDEKEKEKNMLSLGLEIDDMRLIDNQKSRDYIKSLIYNKFGRNASIREVKSDGNKLTEISIYIEDYNSI